MPLSLPLPVAEPSVFLIPPDSNLPDEGGGRTGTLSLPTRASGGGGGFPKRKLGIPTLPEAHARVTHFLPLHTCDAVMGRVSTPQIRLWQWAARVRDLMAQGKGRQYVSLRAVPSGTCVVMGIDISDGSGGFDGPDGFDEQTNLDGKTILLGLAGGLYDRLPHWFPLQASTEFGCCAMSVCGTVHAGGIVTGYPLPEGLGAFCHVWIVGESLMDYPLGNYILVRGYLHDWGVQEMLGCGDAPYAAVKSLEVTKRGTVALLIGA